MENLEQLSAFKKSVEERDFRWKSFDSMRDKLDKKPEWEIVNLCDAALDNALALLLSTKFVTSEWKGLLGENGILNTLDKKVDMAFALGLLSTHNLLMFQQFGDVKRLFDVTDREDLSFEDAPVKALCERLYLPEGSYLTRKVLDMTEPNVRINWNPLQKAKNVRARFLFVFEYLYFDLANRSTFFEDEATSPVEEVTLSMVLAKQEARYQAFLNEANQRQEILELDWKIAQKAKESLESLEKENLTEKERLLLEQKKDANRADIERLNHQLLEAKEWVTETDWTWQVHRDNFSYVSNKVDEVKAKKH